MKNIKLIITTLLIVVLTLILSSSVYAGEVKTVTATEKDGKITVNGTVEEGVLAVAIVVNLDGELNYMETGNVDENGKYSVELAKTFNDGEYEICVADYNGDDYKKTTIQVPTEDSTSKKEDKKENSSNPKTGDLIMLWISILLISMLGIIKIAKLKSKTSRH